MWWDVILIHGRPKLVTRAKLDAEVLSVLKHHDDALKVQLTIAFFEIIAEPPWITEDVELLFTLLDAESTRWAVFSAYKHYPRTFLRHIELYGRGRIPHGEFASWPARQGLEFSPRGLRFVRHDTHERSRTASKSEAGYELYVKASAFYLQVSLVAYGLGLLVLARGRDPRHVTHSPASCRVNHVH